MNEMLPDMFIIPSQIGTYDGTTDPDDHILIWNVYDGDPVLQKGFL